jgi:alkanesulfonate monooxygenase SsuD/methylene tetrahydromethanopterin reductase-like flavin-dependent oxidoreductase (luciferase family)
VQELATYREIFETVNDAPAPAPIVSCMVYCDEDEGRAEDLGRQYISRYYGSVLKHYELAGGHFKTTKDYEYYAKTAERLQGDQDEAIAWFPNLHVFGTPDQCVDKIAAIRDRTGCDHFIGVFSYSGMPYSDARRNLLCFNDKVQPRLKIM